jgi:SAM-dependent methyltransferase
MAPDRSVQITIEIRPDSPIPEMDRADSWQEAMLAERRAGITHLASATAVDRAFLREEHHAYYGRPWVLGRYLFDFARSRGLRPEQRLLDCGCGSGRFAIHAIGFLDEGNYHGVDIHLKSLQALVSYEIPLHDLASKKPRILLNGDFAFGHFGTMFDYAMDCFVSFHFTDIAQNRQFYANLASVLKPGGKLLSLPKSKLPDEEMRRLGFSLNSEQTQACPMLEGHDWISRNEWCEYVRTGDDGWTARGSGKI